MFQLTGIGAGKIGLLLLRRIAAAGLFGSSRSFSSACFACRFSGLSLCLVPARFLLRGGVGVSHGR